MFDPSLESLRWAQASLRSVCSFLLRGANVMMPDDVLSLLEVLEQISPLIAQLSALATSR